MSDPTGISTVPESIFAPAPTQGPLLIGSHTLTPGGSAITVSGTVYSLLPSGRSVVISSPNGFSTVPVANVATPISTDIAGVIASVVGVTQSVSSVTTIIQGSTYVVVGATTTTPISQATGSGNSWVPTFCRRTEVREQSSGLKRCWLELWVWKWCCYNGILWQPCT